MWLSLLGDLSSILGLLISIGGFVVTIRAVKKARQAADEARRAAQRAVSRIGSQLLSQEMGASLHLVRETDSACREKNWVEAIFRCDEARIRLAQLLDHPDLESLEREGLLFAIDGCGIVIPELQKLRDASEPKKPPPSLAKNLHKIITALGGIIGRLRSEALEV